MHTHTNSHTLECEYAILFSYMPSFSRAGEDEEPGAFGLTGGDCAIWTVLHTAAGEAHFPQLGQGNPSPGPHLSHIQGILIHHNTTFVLVILC